MTWIDVNVRVPEVSLSAGVYSRSDIVIALDISGEQCYARYDQYGDWDNATPLCGGYDMEDQITRITHWMPKPDNPS